MFGRGKKRKTTPNLAHRATGSTVAGRPSTLPAQYDFTPAAQSNPHLQTPETPAVVPPVQSTAAHVRNYPPPQQLFQDSVTQQPQMQRTSSVEVQNPAMSTPQLARRSTPQLVRPTPQPVPPDPPPSPVQESRVHNHPSSQGNNFDDDAPLSPDLQEDTLQSLNDLLMLPDREKFVPVLSPLPLPNTEWYDLVLLLFVISSCG